MEDCKNVNNLGSRGQGNKPGQGGERSAGEWWRAPDGQQVGRDSQGQDGEYKGGRQETGGIPNPDDRDDKTSAGSFRGTSDQETGAEATDDDERDIGAIPGRNKDANSKT